MKLLAALFAIIAACAGCNAARATSPVCVPACDACHVCVLFSGGGGTHPPVCAQRAPKPPGCP